MPGAALPELAYHFNQAGDWPKTLDYAAQAGEQALALYAPRAAAEHLSWALEAAGHLRISPGSHLLTARGHAYEMLGEFERARQDYTAGWQTAEAAGDRRAECDALLALGFLWAGRSYTAAGEYFRQALALAEQIGDPALHAHSLNRVGNWYLNQDEPAEAARYHQERGPSLPGSATTQGWPRRLSCLAWPTTSAPTSFKPKGTSERLRGFAGS